MSVEFLVSYDIDTSDVAGQQRLRRVAKACEGFGQRVQKSVFECRLTDVQLLSLTTALNRIIETDRDSVRIYRLPESRSTSTTVLGRTLLHDQRGPLIV